MKVNRVEIYPVSIPYRTPGRHREGDITEAGYHVILKVFTDDGIIGLGEAATGAASVKVYQARDISEIEHFFGPKVIGQNPFDLEKIIGDFRMETMVAKHQLSPTAASAVLDALYDIMGKATNRPLYELLGGAVRKKFGVTRSLNVRSPAEMAKDAVQLKELGYKMITIKVGEDPALDIQRVAAIRKAVGDDYPIEVDANGGYTPDVAIKAIKKMEEYNISGVEQPCLKMDLDGMAEVARAVDTPIIADESAITLSDVMEIVKRRAADVICLKPAKSGGIYISKKMAAVAEAAGIPCSMGSRHPFGIGAAVIHHFTASTACLKPPIGYGSPLERLVDDIVVNPCIMKDGEVSVPEGPGLGVELDEGKLKKYATAQAVVVSG
ncbi:MAG: mandelate racemase/muconate lactonizing enzyme family protein [Deltaproteobacteria bacterium]|nr:mandelate racemase/muconate lactonizing enzyme family protein [Deltaproteobacteria bacterium]